MFFSAVLLTIYITAPDPPAPAQIRQKLKLLSKTEGIDLVFIGSSRTHFQFIPEVFDREASLHGVSVGSFNLGLPGARGHEIDYLLERYVLSHPGLKYVFIEFPGFEYQTPDIHERTFRQIHWHDARRTLDSIKTSLQGPLPPGLRWAEAEDDVMHFVLRSVGRWSKEKDGAFPTDSRGYQESAGKRRGADADARFHHVALYSPDAFINDEVLKRQQARLHELGIETFFIIPPGSSGFRGLDELERQGEIEHVIRLNNPEYDPDLFGPDAFGTKYLLPEGARRYSEKLAACFAEMVHESDHPPALKVETGIRAAMGN